MELRHALRTGDGAEHREAGQVPGARLGSEQNHVFGILE